MMADPLSVLCLLPSAYSLVERIRNLPRRLVRLPVFIRHYILNTLNQLFAGYGFGEKRVSLLGIVIRILSFLSAQKNNREMRKGLAVSQEATEFVAAKIRHHRIGYHDIYRRG